MNHRTFIAAACAAATLAAGCASTPPVDVPPALAPAAGEALVMTLAARGVQIYECRAGAGKAPAWAFVAPDADLFDAAGRRVGHHGAGPHWLADDGSRIDAQVKARADAPTAGAIPWLLLSAKTNGAPGRFAGVTSIQRVNTDGGVAPAGDCSPAGSTERIRYRADYRLFAAR